MLLSTYYIILFILWSIFGSFSTVLISRWHDKESGILLWRSHCPKCWHTLSALELIPILSFLIQNGKCKNCKVRIPYFYPAAEILMGCIFVVIWISTLWLGFPPIGTELLILLIFWFITGVYILYDARYMEIPDQIIVPGIILSLIILLWSLYHSFFETFLFDRLTYENTIQLVQDHLLAAFILYSFFYLQILIPGGIYFLKQKRFRELIELLLSFFLFPISLILSFFGIQKNKDNSEEEPIPAWIGGGDLRIAIFVGLTIGSLHGIISFFLAYILGSIVWIFILLKKWRKNSEISFWPFLGFGWLITLMFHTEIIEYINNILL